MRPGVLPIAALLACALAGSVAAEERGETAATDRPELAGPAGGEDRGEDGIDWWGRLAGDLDAFAELGRGSPVARRAALLAERRRTPDERRAHELAVFGQTQDGTFDASIAAAATEWDLDPFLLKALLWSESRLSPKLVGKRIYRVVNGRRVPVGGGARGIAQFTRDGVSAVNEYRLRRYRTGERVRPFTRRDVMNPDVAIPASAELLHSYIERFGRDGGVTAYNSGPYGGRIVAREGFHAARRAGKLRRVGNVHIQGYRFLTKVLAKTNRLRRAAGLRPLPMPRDQVPRS